MGIKTVTAGIQRIINLGNYENVRYECTASAEVEGDGPFATPELAYQECLRLCKQSVGAELERLKPVKK